MAFSKPLRMIFATFFQPRREIQTEFEVSSYYPTAVRFESEVEPALEKQLYSSIKDRIIARASRLQTIQAGSIHAYLAYIFVTLIALFVVAPGPALFTFGNTARYLDWARGPWMKSESLSFSKSIAISERVNFRLSADFVNSFNMVRWGNPSTMVGTPTFGQVTTTQGSRKIQINMALDF